jgi:hypothetical protein
MINKTFTITYNEVMESIQDHNAQLVFHWLCRFRNVSNGLCCPSLNTLSKNAKLSRSSIIRSLKYLKSSEIIKATQKTGRSNKYIITNSPDQFVIKPVDKLSTTSVRVTPQKCQGDHLTVLTNKTKNITTTPLPPSKGFSDDDVVFFLFYEKVIESYNLILGHSLRTASCVPTDKRKKLVKDRSSKLVRMEDWKKYFEQIAKTSFLLGAGKAGFKADFDWIIEEQNFTKIIEGKYETNAEKAAISELELLEMIKEKRAAGYEIDPEVAGMYAMS